MRKTILFIGSGPSQVKGIKLAKEMGYRAVAVDGNPDAPGLRIADIGIHCDIKETEQVISVAKKNNVDGVLAIASDICLKTAAAVNEALGLPGITRQQALFATDKGRMRQGLKENNISSPRFFIIQGLEDFREAVKVVGFPAVIKPVDSAGSRGVSFISSESALADKYNEAILYSESGTAILEEFMPGSEISVEAFVCGKEVHILTLSDKDRTPPPYFLDTSVKFPSEHSDLVQDEVGKTACQGIHALGLVDCPIHMELILSKDGPRIVEIAARGPGFRVYTDILPHVTGIDGIEAQIHLLFGEKPHLVPHTHLKGACIFFFGSDREGIVKSVLYGQDASSFPPEVFDIDIYVKPGDKVRRLSCGKDRLGHIITLAANRRKAELMGEKVFHNILIEIE